MTTYSVFLKWNPIAGNSQGQRVEYRPKNQTSWIAYQEVSSTTTQLVVGNLLTHLKYDFRVVNICSQSSESPSSSVEFQKLTCPTIQVNTTNDAAALKVTIEDNPSSINYRLDVFKDGSMLTYQERQSSTAQPATLDFAISNLQPDTRYTYQLQFQRNGETKVCPEGSFSTLGLECPAFGILPPGVAKEVKFVVTLQAGAPVQEYVVNLKDLSGNQVATQSKTPSAGDSEIVFIFGSLADSTGYDGELILRKNTVSRSCSTVRAVTLTPVPESPVCNFKEEFKGTWGTQAKDFTVTFSGTIYYMFDAAGIPDKLIVYKNGQVHASFPAYAYRVAGEIPVNPGDQIRFLIDARVTADRSTGWMLHANCSTPYDRNMVVSGWEISIQENNPFINFVTAECTNGQRSFVVNASASSKTQAPVKYYKAVKADILDANGGVVSGKAGESFRNVVMQNGVEVNDPGWQTSPVITMDQSGKALEKGRPYVVYIKDDFGGTQKTGRTFGLGEVIHTLDCEVSYGICPEVTFTQNPSTPDKLKVKIDLSKSGSLGEYNLQIDAGTEGSTSYSYVKNILVQATSRTQYEVEFTGLPVAGWGLLRVFGPWDSTGQKPQCYSNTFATKLAT